MKNFYIICYGYTRRSGHLFLTKTGNGNSIEKAISFSTVEEAEKFAQKRKEKDGDNLVYENLHIVERTISQNRIVFVPVED